MKSILIDNSSLTLVMTCPTRAHYYMNHKREPNQDAMALTFGKALHSALAIRASEPDLSDNDLMSRAMIAIQAAYANIEVGDDWRTAAHAFNTFQKYLTHYPMPDTPVRLPNATATPLVEQPFAYPLGEIEDSKGNIIPVIYQGRIDMAVNFQGEPCVVDHKTCSVFTSTYFDEYRKSNQMMGYCWAVSQMLGTKVPRAMMDVLVCRKPTKTGVAHDFHREVFHYSDTDMEEWKRNVLQILSIWVQYNEANTFPMHTTHCVGKYGRCPYYDVCHVEPQQREAVLNSTLYKPVTWSPFA